ncbi:DUF58 domain-containing protein [Mesobacillus selenatarsenatis]|uniref:DUF58 domain-containing protein n=1 Tax=Mesobacillus selenatarsenatis (strain DSM 18680 / JCM 14380 / FERM P-15431 / SF-1) TaxID=1321606 RepID=A0A0A8X188_MESS1|nr:DUF58 domain-containing protein [Mesobacillus selenatarsenatis]GAM13765.1 hypothetical protein SAMD00020551_1911 [Mesobacillus selenatarsenatis SF-1]
MQWKKIVIEDRFLSILAFLGILLLIASFYINSWLMFGAGLMIIFIAAGNSYYLKHIGEGLFFDNSRKRNRFFIGDKGEWSLQFLNQGLPIMKGNLSIYFDSAVVPVSGEYHIHSSRVDVSLPFSMGQQEKVDIKIPFIAEKRGLSKIRKMELHIPHFFGFGDTILEFSDVINIEALVYPKAISVRNIDKHKSVKPGHNPSNFSLFEDNMGPIGTRDYLPTDSFNRINWKASARKMTLQTKEYERINEAGAVLFINVSDGFSVTSKLEFLMSSTAEMAYFFHKRNIPFSLCMNVRSAGFTPFTYLPLGSGKDHLQKLLDLLAIADFHSPTIPHEQVLFFYKRHLPIAPTMIHAGIRTTGSDGYIQEWIREGVQLLELQMHTENAFLEPLKMKLKDVAGK